MKKALFAPAACVLALAAAGPALAQSTANPCPPGAGNSSYCVDAGTTLGQTVVSAGVKTVSALGIGGLISAKGFTITAKPKLGGTFRYVLRFNDLRPGKHNRSVVVFALLTHIKAGHTLKIHVKLRPIGIAILKYAKAHHKKVRVEIVNHLRPNGATKSIQSLKFLKIS